ncbi:MAG: hypothetical protein V4671_20145 [Armatimonadota bacterium]
MAAAAHAQGTAVPAEVRAASADLNGDGRSEKIAVTFAGQNPVRFTLTVNSTKLVGKADEFAEESPGLRIVKIDSVGKSRQIAIRFIGPNDLEETRFFRWDGKAIRPVGVVPNAPEVLGNGAVYAGVWMGFWRCSQKFALDPKTQTLSYVRQPGYYVGVPATVKQSFPVRSDHAAGSGVVASVAPGSKIELLLFWSPLARPESSGEANGWYLIKTATGLCGWARLDAFREKVKELPYAG